MMNIRIAAAGNTLAPALSVLREKGYRVESSSTSPGSLRATRNEVELFAEDPLILLGLAAIAEARGAQWRASDEEIDAWLALNNGNDPMRD